MSLDRIEEFVRRITRHRLPSSRVRRWVTGLIVFAVLGLSLSSALVPERVSLRVGDVAPRDITAPEVIVDKARTEELQRQKAETVPAAYSEDPLVVQLVEQGVRDLFTKATPIATDVKLSAADKMAHLRATLVTSTPLTDTTLETIARSNASTLANLTELTVDVLKRVLANGVKPEGIEQAQLTIRADAGRLSVTSAQRQVVSELARDFVRPNMILNAALTESQRREAMESVEPVTIPKGAIIVRKGDVVTAEQIAILEDIGIQRRGGDFRSIAGTMLLALLIVLVDALYLRRYRQDIYLDDGRLAMTALVLLITLILTKAVLLLNISPYLAPVAVGTILLTILVGSDAALVGALTMSFSLGLMTGYDLRAAFVALIGGLAGIYGVARVEQRSDLMRAGFVVSGASAASIFVLELLARSSFVTMAPWQSVLWGLLNGAVTFIFTTGVLPVFESLFDVLTPVKLLELSSPEQPLLRQLMTEAPGTYHHSVIVGNLAEAATRVVGGNALLARVGAYYHDIGKAKRPYFFIENQVSGDNPHTKLSPHLSALIIASHTRDGAEMGRTFGLPQAIVDIIQQHHGTTLITYFYRRACEEAHDDDLPQNDFRHHGPKPQTREAAIVMMADSVEAAVRSLSDPTTQRIDLTIRKIIAERLSDGQLENCDLTLRDLDRIGTAFNSVLSGIFHPRIEYPESVIREMKESLNHAGNDQQRTGQGSGQR